MKIGLFLHFHQPPTQFPEIIQAISLESYQKILALLEAYPEAKLTFNLTNSFLEQVNPQVIERIKAAVGRGGVELAATAAYHPLLPFLPEMEMKRQILLSQSALKKYFGLAGPGILNQESRIKNGLERKTHDPKFKLHDSEPRLRGFFPPEMAVDEKVLAVIAKSGFEWVVTEETAFDDPDPNHVVFAQASGLKMVRRHRQLSLAIAFSQIRHLGELTLKAQDSKLETVVLAIDAETFGHHRPEQLLFLEELLKNSGGRYEYEMVTVSEIVDLRLTESFGRVVKPSTWGGSFDRWRNPKNPIHRLQWQLTNLAIGAVENSNFQFPISNLDPKELARDSLTEDQKRLVKSRLLLDRALHSDQYWWAAHDPCWHLPMVERGAKLLLNSVEALPGAESEKKEAKILYRQIREKGIEIFGEAIIGC